MRQRTPERSMLFACVVIALSFWNFSRIQGCDCIRAIHIVTLLVAGIGIGVLITSIKAWFIKRQQEKEL
ncbi:MAG TPA: hypothetical protein VIM07_14840 [Chitinophagaceae bacterium]|jgi:hypothetical protein